MEVLNQNQRRSAYWRIILLTFFTIALLFLVLFSAYKTYASQGLAEIEKLQKEHEKGHKKFLKEKRGIEDDINEFSVELKKCKEGLDNPRLKNCFDRLDKKEENLTDLENELESCQGDLDAATSF